jgi:hypothetical protein
MTRILGSLIAIVIIVVLEAPFVREAYQRYQLARDLDTVMNERDREAFVYWQGDAASFGRSLFERCELENGRGSPLCQRYGRFAAK